MVMLTPLNISMSGRRAIILAFLLLGLASTAWGIVQFPSFLAALPWNGSGGVRFAGLLAALSLAVFLLGKATHLPHLFSAALVAVLIATMLGHLWPLLVVGWIAFSSIVLGGTVLAFLSPGDKPADRSAGLLVGVGLLAMVISFLAPFPINYPALYATLLLLPILAAPAGAKKLALEIRDTLLSVRGQRSENSLLQGIVGVLALVHVVAAFFPEVGYDALAMHLFISGYLEANHQWGFDVSRYVWAVMPSLGDWVYALGFMLGGEPSVRLINVAFILLLALLIRRLAIWAFSSEQAGLWSAALFLSTPLTFTLSSSLFIESIWASYVVGGLYCLFRLGDAGDRVTHCLIGSGLLLGFACAAKAVTLAMAPVLLIAFLAQARRWISRDAIVPLLIGGGGFSLLGSVPYVRAWLISGNPVFPFYNGIFKSEYFPPENFSQPHFMRGFSWDTIYQITFDSGKYLEASAGASGFQWLLLLCGGIAALLLTHRWRGAWIALIGILMVAAVFQHQSYLRYIFPATILLAVPIGGAYATVFSSTAAMRWPSYALFGVALLLNLAFLNAGAYFRDMPLASIVSDDARRDYRTDFVR